MRTFEYFLAGLVLVLAAAAAIESTGQAVSAQIDGITAAIELQE